MTRAVIDVASRFLRQPVIVENKAGGGTVVGTQAARFAPADGYTLLFQGTALITNVLSLKQPGYELRDFTPVAILAETKVVLMSPLKPHLSTVKDLVSFAKANPGTLNYAILGRGTASHIMGHRFGRSARFNWVEIPYKGAVEASNAILSGESDALFASQFAAQALAESGKAKLLAVASSTRVKSLPDVPTFAELGYPDMDDEGSVFVIYVRSETPPAIVEKLRDAFGRAAKSDEFAARRDNQGLSEYTGTIDDFNAQFKASTARLANEFKELSITPQ
jgi:tripartite-type tricarboxylate transporter receptor subunit TctC